MKLSAWDDQVVNNFLNNNANYQDQIEDMFNNNTNSNQKMDGDFNYSHLGMNQNLNFSSFGSFLAGKFVSNRRVRLLIVWPMIIWPLVVWIVWLLNVWPLIIWPLIVWLLLFIWPWIVWVVWLLIFSCPGSSIPDLGQSLTDWVTATLEFLHEEWLLRLQTIQTFGQSDKLKKQSEKCF